MDVIFANIFIYLKRELNLHRLCGSQSKLNLIKIELLMTEGEVCFVLFLQLFMNRTIVYFRFYTRVWAHFTFIQISTESVVSSLKNYVCVKHTNIFGELATIYPPNLIISAPSLRGVDTYDRQTLLQNSLFRHWYLKTDITAKRYRFFINRLNLSYYVQYTLESKT